MRAILFLFVLVFSIGCAHQLKPKHFIGRYEFASGKDFMSLRDCSFSIDSNLRWIPCPTITEYWSNPIAPLLATELYEKYNTFSFSSEDSLKYQGDFKKYMLAEFDSTMKKLDFFIQGAINDNAYEFRNPKRGPKGLYINWRIYRKSGNKYILESRVELDDATGAIIFSQRPIIKVK
jgi:hypothetical protein